MLDQLYYFTLSRIESEIIINIYHRMSFVMIVGTSGAMGFSTSTQAS